MNANVIEQMRATAAADNRAARETWDDIRGPYRKQSRVRDELHKLLGTGISHGQAAKMLGVSRPAVSSMLRREGWTL